MPQRQDLRFSHSERNTVPSYQIDSQTQWRYFSMMLLALNVIWIATLSWFSNIFEMHYDQPMVFLWMCALSMTFFFALWQLNHSTPAEKKTAFFQQQHWLVILMWVSLINTGLLYETGGGINPLIHLLLFPLALGMFFLELRAFAILGALTIGLFVALNYFYVPIHSLKVTSLQAFFAWHLKGSMWVFILLVLLLAMVIMPLRFRLQQQQKILQTQQNQALQSEYALSIGTMASASLHQLSTPLNTITLLQDLLQHEVKSEMGKEYLATMAEQLKVCTSALQNLRQHAESAQNTGHQASFAHFAKSLEHEFLLIQPKGKLTQTFSPSESVISTAQIINDMSFKLALLNLLDNAARYSLNFVLINWSLQGENLLIEITDMGGGIANLNLQHFGMAPSNEYDGTGMGVFLSRTIIERLGGKISFENMKAAANSNEVTGLKVSIAMPNFILYD